MGRTRVVGQRRERTATRIWTRSVIAAPVRPTTAPDAEASKTDRRALHGHG